MRKDSTAKIIVGGDVNGMFSKVNTCLQAAGFKPALIQGTPTHTEGNKLDQIWTRNVAIINAIVADPLDQVSDHRLIQVRMEATLIERGITP